MILRGSDALAEGLYRMGVQVVTGYPGSPATGVLEAYKKLVEGKEGYQGRWMINEKVSLEYALGHAFAGRRAATVVKNVGFNLIMDPLAIAAFTGVRGACLILLGDDPGARGSSHEQDARLLAAATEVPVLEPATASRALEVVKRGVDISERHRVPVVIRFTPDFVGEEEEVPLPPAMDPPPLPFRSLGEVTGYTCLAHQAISLHAKLHKVLDDLSHATAISNWQGSGEVGVIGVGGCWLKVKKVLAGIGEEGIKLMRLEQVNPLPSQTLLKFLTELKRVLVVEEVLPFVEEKVTSLCHRHHLEVEVWGKLTGHLPREDVLLLQDIYRGVAEVTSRKLGEQEASQFQEEKRMLVVGKPLCSGCPYAEIIEALNRYWNTQGLTPPALAAEPGCGVHVYYPPYEKVDVKLCMGSGSPVVSALASLFPGERPVALIGDSSFLNSGVPALIQVCRLGAPILIFIVNNYSAALTGFQPPMELEEEEIRETLEKVIQGARPAYFASVDEEGLGGMDEVIHKAHLAEGPSVILVNAPCPEAKT